ncbi:MAG: hypothetical protein U0166_11720 [Acidobacteriota bacterium]
MIVALLLTVSIAGADALNEEWVTRDTAGIEALLSLMPVESRTAAELTVAGAGARCSTEKHDLGFGGELLEVRWPHGYSYTHALVVLFEGRVASYEISVEGSAGTWKQLRRRYRDAWERSGGPRYEESDCALRYRMTVEPLMDSLLAAVAKELGPVRPVKVPRWAREAYRNLTSPSILIPISEGPVGYAGISREEGPHLDELIAEGRIAVVENVLRSPNPQGRVYATLALLKAKDAGRKLSAETERAMEAVAQLSTPIASQEGCMVTGGRSASSVIAEFRSRSTADRSSGEQSQVHKKGRTSISR